MPKDRSRDPKNALAHCPECQTGVLYLQHITYFTWLNEELITVPHFPAWICDLCGRREYDPRAIKWLNALLHPEAGRHAPLRQRTPSLDQTLGTEQPQSADHPQP